MLKAIRIWHRRRQYRTGGSITKFIARDIRREVEVLDASRIADGVLLVRICTWNVLYADRGIVPKPSMGAARWVRLDEIWNWSGEAWGGPVPPGADATAGAGGGVDLEAVGDE
jgi:hypothetical protein